MMRGRFSQYFTALVLCTAATDPGRLMAEVTFSKDIAPIIFNKCTSCHREGEAAPFVLQSFSDVKKRGDLIAHVVDERLMPPWKADKGATDFRGDRRLNEAEIKLISTWSKNGMPEGNPADLPSIPQYTPGWSLGEPDLIVTMSKAYQVPAEGPDIYWNFVLPLNQTTDRWVTAIDFRPSARAVVHHSLFFFESTGRARKLDSEDPGAGFKGGMGALVRLRGGQGMGGGRGNNPSDDKPNEAGGGGSTGESPKNNTPFGSLGGWALGAQPRFLPDGLAYYLPAGADLILSTHFHPSGKVEEEVSTVGIYFSKEPAKQRFTGLQLPPSFGAFKNIDIPPGEKEYVVEDSFEIPVDVQAFGVSAHAHYLAKTMKLTATLPSGEERTMLSIPDWDFAWQEQYQFTEFVPLPKGTKLHSRITYDNSTDNPRNPANPPTRVRFGEETTNEMASLNLMVVAANQPEMPQLMDTYRGFTREAMMKAPFLRMFQGRANSK